MSVRNVFSHVSAESPTASALTLHTRASMPPSSPAVDAIHAVNAGPSATSSARPKALTPFAFNDATAAATSSAVRAQIETLAPSAANPSATARPIPLLPPVTTARFPLSPRSMSALPVCGHVHSSSSQVPTRAANHWSPGSIPQLGSRRVASRQSFARPLRLQDRLPSGSQSRIFPPRCWTAIPEEGTYGALHGQRQGSRGRRQPQHTPAMGDPRTGRPHRNQVRLRRRAVRRVHGAPRTAPRSGPA
jgi:hypothetical protein